MWLLPARTPRNRPSYRRVATRPAVERLEDRCVPAFLAPVALEQDYSQVGDFNGDGVPDLVAVNSGTVSVRPGNGDGTFAPALYSPGGGATFRPEIGDLNNDGSPDLVTANADGLLVLLGNGDGTFRPPAPPLALPPVSGESQTLGSIRLGDLNNDGRLDVIAGGFKLSLEYNGLFGYVWVRRDYGNVFPGDGSGSFLHTSTAEMGGNLSALEDFNGDGDLDLLTGSSGSGYFGPFWFTFLCAGNGNGTFQAASLVATGIAGGDVVGDFNGDGNLDFAGSSGHYDESVTVVPGNGNGTFQTPTIYPGSADRRSLSVALGDVNGDENPDLVTTSSDKDVSVLLGNGDGSFQLPQFLPTASLTGRPTLSDLDGNGFSDLVAGALLFNDGIWAAGDPQPPSLPSVTISDETVTEGDGGTTNAVFTVTLSHAGASAVSVKYEMIPSSGTATLGVDFLYTTGTLFFAAGETSKTITIAVVGDTTVEPDEIFFVRLFTPVGATVADGYGAGTIVNDDIAVLPAIHISDVSKSEGRNGKQAFTFTVTLSAPSDEPVTVNYTTSGGTATAGEDYEAISGTLTFAPGETTRTITVWVKGERKKETNEIFFINLSGAINALIEDGQGLGTIVNDD